MITIDVNSEISNVQMARFFYGDRDLVFGLDSLKEIFANEKDDEVLLNIHCPGGSVAEGLAIYDYLRSSGKKIFCNIEGDCHSMAIILLLSAPKENRTCSKNASALIHKVRSILQGDFTKEDLEKEAQITREYEERILNIYAERTQTNKETLRGFMQEEKIRNADFLLKYGFVGKINDYNTNILKQKEQTEIKKLAMEMKNLIQRAKAFLGVTPLINFDFKDAEGSVMLSTEAEDDTLEVGMKAEPDGIFTLSEDTKDYKAGTVVTVSEGVITDIQPKESEEDAPEDEEKKALKEENAQLREEIQKLKEEALRQENRIKEAKDIINGFLPEERKTGNNSEVLDKDAWKEKFHNEQEA